jgi:hypothetical protein
MKSRKVFRVLHRIAVEAVPDTVDLRSRVRAEIARRQAQRRRLFNWRNMVGLATVVFTGLVLFAYRPAITTPTLPPEPSVTQLIMTTVTPLGKFHGMEGDAYRRQPMRTTSTYESWPE